MQWLQANRPDLVDRYRELYRRGAYAPVQERRRLAQLLEGAQIQPTENERWSFADAARASGGGAGARTGTTLLGVDQVTALD